MSFCVLVSGGTNFTDFEFLRLDLDGYLKDKGVTPILSGCARGAERLAIRYAEAWGSPVLRFPGPWQETSAAARARYRRMLDKSDAVVLFWDGKDQWTVWLENEAIMRSLSLHVVSYDPVIISGAARGADTLGARYARERGVPVLEFPADWVRLGKRAGMVRNLQMLDSADAVVAFWDGQSRGTAHMINETKKRGLPLRVVRYQKGG